MQRRLSGLLKNAATSLSKRSRAALALLCTASQTGTIVAAECSLFPFACCSQVAAAACKIFQNLSYKVFTFMPKHIKKSKLPYNNGWTLKHKLATLGTVPSHNPVGSHERLLKVCSTMLARSKAVQMDSSSNRRASNSSILFHFSHSASSASLRS